MTWPCSKLLTAMITLSTLRMQLISTTPKILSWSREMESHKRACTLWCVVWKSTTRRSITKFKSEISSRLAESSLPSRKLVMLNAPWTSMNRIIKKKAIAQIVFSLTQMKKNLRNSSKFQPLTMIWVLKIPSTSAVSAGLPRLPRKIHSWAHANALAQSDRSISAAYHPGYRPVSSPSYLPISPLISGRRSSARSVRQLTLLWWRLWIRPTTLWSMKSLRATIWSSKVYLKRRTHRVLSI